MTNIGIAPYSKIEDQKFMEGNSLRIDAQTFSERDFEDGRITFSFIGCDFKNIIIENFEEIEFKEISILFLSCYIENIQVENIISRNISISFLSSILSGRISSSNLLSVEVNNCIAINGLFLLDQRKVNILYTEENIFLKRWQKLFGRIGIDFITLIKTKQSIYIHNAGVCTFKTNEVECPQSGCYKRAHESRDECKIGYYLTAEQKAMFDLNLTIKYLSESRDKV